MTFSKEQSNHNLLYIFFLQFLFICVLALLQVEGVGLYFRQQLLQSRHRGAFELAYVGFVRLTDMLCRCVFTFRAQN